MSSRATILTALRARPSVPSPAPLPDLNEPFCVYDDKLTKFSEVVASVGGSVVAVRTLEEGLAILLANPAYRAAKHICSLVEGLGESNVDLAKITDPHELENIDFAVVQGRLGVAENGAVWVREADVPKRALLFITQHLALVVSRNALFNNLHEAYSQLDLGRAEFGVFISGPSKTADIEQSLVIGAHGARSLVVLVVG